MNITGRALSSRLRFVAYRKGLEAKHKKSPNVIKNILLKFSMINFGDGQGFEAGQHQDLRGKISEGSSVAKHMKESAKLLQWNN